MKVSDESERFRLLYDLGGAFAARLELDELVPLIVEKCRDVLDAEGVAVLMLDSDGSELFFPYVAERDPAVLPRLIGVRFPADRGLAGVVIESGKSLRVDDVQSDPRFFDDIDRVTGMTTRNLLAAPLRSHQGTVGVIQAVNHLGDQPFDDGDLEFLEALSGSIAIAIENARLHAQVKSSEERLRAQVGVLRRDLARHDLFTELIGTGAAMAEVFRLMESASASAITVLVEGETGTGKELVARALHRSGPRAEGPFLAVNCASLTETLLESELFGHRRGAFTGATQDRRGLFEAAADGTIFLDEVADMPATMQAKLLRVLQEGEVVPVGDTRPRKVDVRVISATNRDLRVEVAARRFREDLYYRLAGFPIRVPPLRDRREDIPILVSRFIHQTAERNQKKIKGIEPAALEILLRFDWPGNVRELQNEIERAVVLAPVGESIAEAHLSAKLVAPGRPPAAVPPAAAVLPTSGKKESLQQARDRFESSFAMEVLERHGGNVSRAAEALGISRVMLHRKLKKYGLR